MTATLDCTSLTNQVHQSGFSSFFFATNRMVPFKTAEAFSGIRGRLALQVGTELLEELAVFTLSCWTVCYLRFLPPSRAHLHFFYRECEDLWQVAGCSN